MCLTPFEIYSWKQGLHLNTEQVRSFPLYPQHSFLSAKKLAGLKYPLAVPTLWFRKTFQGHLNGKYQFFYFSSFLLITISFLSFIVIPTVYCENEIQGVRHQQS